MSEKKTLKPADADLAQRQIKREMDALAAPRGAAAAAGGVITTLCGLIGRPVPGTLVGNLPEPQNRWSSSPLRSVALMMG